MSQPTHNTIGNSASPQQRSRLEHLENHFGRRLAQHLNAHEAQPGYAVSERLRAARMQALAAVPPANVHTVGNTGGSAILAGISAERLWLLAITLLAVFILLSGTLHISRSSQTMHIQHLAQVDTQLLSNDLPLSAYTDPGFEQFLYNRQAATQADTAGRSIQTQ